MLVPPRGEGRFARGYARGTWINDVLCRECGQAQSELVPPLLVEWGPAIGQVLGDFTACGASVISESCSQRMETELGLQFRTEPVKTIKERVHKQPPPSSPDQGGLLWLRGACMEAAADNEQGQALVQRCPACKRRKGGTMFGKMLVCNRKALESALFEVPDYGGSTNIYAAEAVRDRLARANFSNLAFLRAGYLV